ncbi:geranylgeranyl transferase type-2 alpha subunit [Melampsora americana]|nr:geranylgeranyl transferase type-2 alpha subunit [Melampsora americana]
MHGVQRPKTVTPRHPDEIAEEKLRLEEYRLLNTSLLERNHKKEFEESDSFDLSTALLTLNPEHVTAWSFRRKCLMKILESNDSKENPIVLEKLNDEMKFTFKSFENHPKSYSIWEHRKWVLKQMKHQDWLNELKLVEKLLQKDGRNFHAWGYRRFLISMISSQDDPLSSKERFQSELDFTSKQIESNFSNFSAWHYRSRLLETDFLDHKTDEKEIRLKKEFEWVRNALWIDPNDQSGWLYHRWLMSHNEREDVRQAEIESIKELLEVEPDSRWALATLLQYCPNQVDVLNKLVELDPLRQERYLDVAKGFVKA